MAFVEAFRQFQFRVGRENFCSVHVSLIPKPKATSEHKTKPTQASVRELRGLGISPDIIVCRSEEKVEESIKEKISNFCHVKPEQVKPRIRNAIRTRYRIDGVSSLLRSSTSTTAPASTTCRW